MVVAFKKRCLLWFCGAGLGAAVGANVFGFDLGHDKITPELPHRVPGAGQHQAGEQVANDESDKQGREARPDCFEIHLWFYGIAP